MHAARLSNRPSTSKHSLLGWKFWTNLLFAPSKGLAKLANIACQTLLFVFVSIAMDNQRTLLFGREQWCLASSVGQFCQAFNAIWSCFHNDTSRISKWPNGRLVAVVKHCSLFAQGRGGCKERRLKAFYWTGAQKNASMFSTSWREHNSFI